MHRILPSSVCVLLYSIACAVLLICWTRPSSADGFYPRNPVELSDALIVSSSGLRRIRRSDLETLWEALTGVDTFEPVHQGTRLFVGSRRGLHALDTGSGATVWSHATDTTLFSPVVSENRVFTGGLDGSVRALARNTGRQLWKRHFDGWLYTPALVGNTLITGGEGGVVYGISTSNGGVLWKRSLEQQLVYRPVDTGHGVVVTTFDGGIRLLDPATGSVIWRVRDPVASFSPVPGDKRLYFGRYDGALQLRALTDGRLLWSRQLEGRLSLPVTLHNNTVIAASRGGEIAAFDRTSGRVRWRCTVDAELIARPVVTRREVLAFTEQGARRFAWQTCPPKQQPQ